MRVKRRFIMQYREPVPGANILAYVAAKHPVIHFTLKLGGYFVFEFDGEI